MELATIQAEPDRSPPEAAGGVLSGLTTDMGVLHHLAAECRERREDAPLTQGRVGAALTYLVDRGGQNTITKFEALANPDAGTYQPENLEAVVEAYAQELGINALVIWAAAIERARLSEVPPRETVDKTLERGRRSGDKARSAGRSKRRAN